MKRHPLSRTHHQRRAATLQRIVDELVPLQHAIADAMAANRPHADLIARNAMLLRRAAAIRLR